MPSVLVRGLPEQVHRELQRRAEQAGQSLQQYLVAELARLAATPTMADVLERISRRKGGRVGLDAAVRDLTDERARR